MIAMARLGLMAPHLFAVSGGPVIKWLGRCSFGMRGWTAGELGLSDHAERSGEQRDLAVRVARLERELAAANAALAAKPIVDRAQLFALTEAMPVLVSVIGRDERYEFANKAYQSWFGPDDGPDDGRVVGRLALDVLGPAAYDLLRPNFERALAGEPVSFEADIPDRSGGTRHVHATFAPRAALDGEITGIVVLIIDLSGRFVDETALRESEDHYRHAVELNPQTSWTATPDGQRDHVSSRWQEWTGTSGLGSSSLEGLHADDRVHTLETWGNAVATGEPYDIEHRVKMRDGGVRWMHSRAFPRRDDVGRIVKWYGTTEDVHDRKTAEAALAAEVAERGAILEQLAEGVVITDAKGGITFVNEAAARIHGMARLHVGCADYAQTYGLFTEDGESYPSLDLPLARAVRGETVTEARWLIRRPDSEILAVGSARPVIDLSGRQIGAVLTLRDDSARETAEAMLRESESRFRAMADDTQLMIWTTDPSGFCTYLNRAWYGFTGQTREQAEGFGWLEATHPDDKARADEAFRAANAAQAEFRSEYRLRRADGSYAWAIDAASPRFAEEGSYLGSVGSVVDIDEVTRSQQALAASDQRFRAAVDAVEVVVWTNDAEGRMSGDQPGWSALTGQTEAEYSGYGWATAVHSEDAQPTVDAWNEAVRERRPFVFEHRVHRADGECRLFSVRAIPAFGGDDTITEWVGVHTDITDQRAAEEALRDQTRTLETLNRTGAAVAAELDLERVVQMVTDAGVEVTGAAMGAFFYNVLDDTGESFMLFTLSGAEQSAFDDFGMPRATMLFQPTFRGEAIVRSDDILADPRYGLSEPHRGLPKGHPPVRSFLSLPVTSRSGEVVGGLFFGHPETGRFNERHERLMTGIAAQAAIAIDNARLYQSAQREIEERRRAEEAARDSEARFRLIADSAPVPMWMTRLDRQREFVNRAYVDFVGVGYDDAVDFDWRTILHPDDAARILAEQVEKEASLRPFTLEARYRDAHGGWCWLRSESQPRWDADGGHAGFIGVAYDVTLAKEAEFELAAKVAERTAERDAVWRTSRDLIVVFAAADGRYRNVNPAWTTELGYVGSDLAGVRFDAMVHPQDREAAQATLGRLSSGDKIADFEVQVRAADGSFRPYSWNAYMEDGLIYAVGRDLTTRKQLEERLRQSQKMEAVGQLTGGVAHDFNNLLTPIMGSLDMLRRRLPADDSRAQRTVDTALQATERAATLVQRLLAFARRQDLQARAVDVAALLTGMTDLMARSLGTGVRVSIDVPPDLAPASVDPNQLELAILNLSINARDAMPGGGTLRITAREVAADADDADLKTGRYVRIAVADTGIGMDADTVRRAVEPFFSTKGVGKGTGLGLSMVYGFAAQLGGALRLSSAPGIGTTAELWLPVSDEPATAEDDLRPTPQPAPRSANILLVDDEDLVRMGTADMLTDLGYVVAEARSATEALALLKAREVDFDLLVTDYLMPGMNGAELAEAARHERPNLPVLLITGYTNLAEGAPADLPRLTKPFRQDDLAERVAALIEA